MSRRRIAWVLEAAVGAAFIYTGIAKALDPQPFVSSILSYELVGYRPAVLLAMVVPYLEICSGFGLVTRFFDSGARLWAATMAASFAALNALAIARGLDIDCGCFGEQAQLPLSWTLAIDLLMLGALKVAARFRSTPIRRL